jgi:hypothetical protein
MNTGITTAKSLEEVSKTSYILKTKFFFRNYDWIKFLEFSSTSLHPIFLIKSTNYRRVKFVCFLILNFFLKFFPYFFFNTS